MTDNIPRQPAGSPQGGQFAATGHAEAEVDLGKSPNQEEVEDLAIGFMQAMYGQEWDPDQAEEEARIEGYVFSDEDHRTAQKELLDISDQVLRVLDKHDGRVTDEAVSELAKTYYEDMTTGREGAVPWEEASERAVKAQTEGAREELRFASILRRKGGYPAYLHGRLEYRKPFEESGHLDKKDRWPEFGSYHRAHGVSTFDDGDAVTVTSRDTGETLSGTYATWKGGWEGVRTGDGTTIWTGCPSDVWDPELPDCVGNDWDID